MYVLIRPHSVHELDNLGLGDQRPLKPAEPEAMDAGVRSPQSFAEKFGFCEARRSCKGTMYAEALNESFPGLASTFSATEGRSLVAVLPESASSDVRTGIQQVGTCVHEFFMVLWGILM